MADVPASSASRNCSREVPNADTTPIPVTTTVPDIDPYVTIRAMPLQWLRVALVVLACAIAPLDATTADLFDEIYARGKPIESGLKTLTADFTETSTSSLLAEPLRTSGTLTVVRPSQVVLHYTADNRTIRIDGDVMRVIWPAQKLDRQTSIGAAQRRIQRYFVDKSPAELRSHFDIAATDAADRVGAWLVTMTPKRKQIREGISKLELWIDRTTVVLAAMKMTFPNGDTKLMEFSNVKINAPAVVK
jgi:outer membrane lipoprotein-sorting protein